MRADISKPAKMSAAPKTDRNHGDWNLIRPRAHSCASRTKHPVRRGHA